MNMSEQPLTASPLTEADRLAEAFRAFNRVSEELTGAYANLQDQVSRLTEELAIANSALNRELREKAALTERLELLLDALPAGVVVLAPDGKVAQANPAAHALLGEGIETRLWEDLTANLLQSTGAPREWIIPSCGARPQRRVALEVTELDSAGGRIVLVNDITEAHRQKSETARRERLAAMGEMAASLAHQLRTPLSAALLYTANITQPGISERLRNDCAEKAVARLKHLERLIQDVLLFVRGEVLGREPIPVPGLMAELNQMVEPVAATRGVQLALVNGVGDAVITGERKALTGALVNLLENALQAVEPGGHVELRVEAVDHLMHFRVLDDGRGIDPALAERLFEPFFTTRAEGTGLGLAIARGVARAHGGGIEVLPRPEGGSEFVFSVLMPDAEAQN